MIQYLGFPWMMGGLGRFDRKNLGFVDFGGSTAGNRWLVGWCAMGVWARHRRFAPGSQLTNIHGGGHRPSETLPFV
jgi:hypothetical protein